MINGLYENYECGAGIQGELKTQATPTMLLKTNVEKMSGLAHPTMFMKTSNIEFVCHDVYENKLG